MDTNTLLKGLRECMDQLPEIMSCSQGIHNPKVKAWRTKVFELLADGGSTCQKALRSMRNLGLETIPLEDTFINQQSYISQLEAIKKIVSQTIQTIEIFGRPEDKDKLPDWGKPRSKKKAKGHLWIGDQEVDPSSITIHEIMDCLHSYIKESNDLTEEMRADLAYHLRGIIDNDLFHPFLKGKLDAVLAHWE